MSTKYTNWTKHADGSWVRSHEHETWDLEVDEDYLDIRVDGGFGYETFGCSITIPWLVLKELLATQGLYIVTAEERK